MDITTVVILLVLVLIIFIALNNITFVNTDTSSVQSNCTQTQYGCCPDGINSKINQSGSNCSVIIIKPPIGGCAGTIYGCCPNSTTPKTDQQGSNCYNPNPKLIGGCAGTRYGCCPNNTTPKMNPQGSNCPYLG